MKVISSSMEFYSHSLDLWASSLLQDPLAQVHPLPILHNPFNYVFQKLLLLLWRCYTYGRNHGRTYAETSDFRCLICYWCPWSRASCSRGLCHYSIAKLSTTAHLTPGKMRPIINCSDNECLWVSSRLAAFFSSTMRIMRAIYPSRCRRWSCMQSSLKPYRYWPETYNTAYP